MTKHYGDWHVLGDVVGKNVVVGSSSQDPSGLRFAYPINDSDVGKLIKVADVDGFKQSVFVDITGSSPLTITNGPSAIDVALSNSGVTAGVYGSATLVPVITVSAKGIITSLTTVTVSGGGGGSGNLTGTLTPNRIPFASGTSALSDSTVTFTSTGGISSRRSGSNNEMFGFRAGNTSQTGGANTLVGNSAGPVLSSGNYNTALGWQSLNELTTGSTNTALGIQAGGRLVTGSGNTLTGDEAGYYNVAGSDNVAAGRKSMYGWSGGANAENNVSIGVETLSIFTSAAGNTALGHQALNPLGVGHKNIGLGYRAGFTQITSTPNISKTFFVGDSADNNGINDIYIYSENAYGPVFQGNYRFGNDVSFSGIISSTDNDFRYDGTTLSISGNTVEPLLSVSSVSVTGTRSIGHYSYSGFNGISIGRRDGYTNYIGNQVPGSSDVDDVVFSSINNSDSPTEIMRLTNETRNLVMTGEILAAASTTNKSGFNLAHGVAPTSPVNGDIWTTTLGIFVRINGVTVGPLIDSSSIGELTTITSDTVLTAAYTTIIVDASSNPVLITVPLASNHYSNGKGKIFNIKRIDSSSNLVSIVRSGSDTFVTTTAGISSFTLEEGESYSIQADGANARWPVL
jgi:hypothetical protein